MRSKLLTTLSAALLLVGCCTESTPSKEAKRYEAEWSSLAQHQTPQWLLDAKFGIYCHWGPQTYNRSKPGEKLTILDGFKGWTGENFDAAEWATLFQRWGAQFAGPVAQHCSGCVNWDSEITDWNSTNHGPKRDIVGELSPEIKKRGMKFMASFHSISFAGVWGQISRKDRTYVEPIFAWDSLNREDKRWMEGWIDRIEEATAKYDIDLAWFDNSFGQTIGGDLRGHINQGKYTPDGTRRTRIGGLCEEYQQKMIANYYNLGLDSGRDVEIVYKSYDVPRNVGMRNVENGNLDGGQYDPWMTDVSILSLPEKGWDEIWFYGENNVILSSNFIIDMLIDVVSKNGRMLLNVPPCVDGTFAPQIIERMDEIGEWLKINGEAIYAANPWCLYGEGPAYIKHPGHHGLTKAWAKENPVFTDQDIRYTTKGADIYAFVLDKPQSEEILFKSLGSYNKLYPGEVKGVTLLGSDTKIEWRHEEDALVIITPDNLPQSAAYCFKIHR
ncbi:MAG: alpha-L-fucosidase [Rikenellaceae bacterium]